MAIMIPPEVSAETRSRHERSLFSMFKTQLNDNYYVLHSYGVNNHRRKLWAEADFIIISPKGIFVLEVKGGGVSFEDGKWWYISHDGKRHDGREGPWKQAKDVMYALKDKIESDERNRGFAFGYGVILPDETIKISCAEIDEEVLLCAENWVDDVGKYIRGLEDYWLERNKNLLPDGPRYLDKQERDIIRKMLRPDIPTAYTLKSRISNLESRIVELTDEQEEALEAIDLNPRTIVMGGTGTGKTILAFNKAVNLARANKRVLFLCYNLLLADSIIENVPNDLALNGALKVEAIYRYMEDVLSKAEDEEDEKEAINETDWYSEILPLKYSEAICEMSSNDLFDVIIIDEAQDIMTEANLEAIDLSLKGGLKNGEWHFFMDPLQDIFSRMSCEISENLKEYKPSFYRLTKNCRNCNEIIRATKEISGIDFPCKSILDGGNKKIIGYKDRKDFRDKLVSEVELLIKGDLKLSDFIILSTKKIENSIMSDMCTIAGYPVYDLRYKPEGVESIDFCTIQAFKGLEQEVVIVIDLEPPNYESSKRLLYTGLSRAKVYLSVFIDKEHSFSDREL